MNKKGPACRQAGFTIMELMIAVTIVSIIAVSFYSANLLTQLKKGRDSRRKQEMTTVVKVLEDYYNDKNAYPTVVPSSSGSIDGLGCKSNPQGLQPYMSQIPCDPQYPSHTYLYTTDDPTAQQIRIYAIMEYPKDPDVMNNACSIGCSVGGQNYNYVITSSNVDLSTPVEPGAIIP
ncbi:prepilin-type N-terminal cleavage/methylation domain-containing protein [Candidatus Gottesmanbacteria bacterium]|nr:prepilin-type N-terminal cleavage/methylation domain-containing protein [Candidatus Gottesmanbacteria bacterium]